MASVLVLTIASVVGFAVYRWFNTAWPDGPLLEVAAVSEDLVLELREGEPDSGFGAHLLLRHRLDGPEWTTKVYGVQPVAQRMLVDAEHIFVRAIDAKGNLETHAFGADSGDFAFRTAQVEAASDEATTEAGFARAFLDDLLIEVYPRAVIAVRRSDGEEVFRHPFDDTADRSLLQSADEGLRLLRRGPDGRDAAFVIAGVGVTPIEGAAELWCEGTDLRLVPAASPVPDAAVAGDAVVDAELPAKAAADTNAVALPEAHGAHACVGDAASLWGLLSSPSGDLALRVYDRRRATWHESAIPLGASKENGLAVLARRDDHGATLLVVVSGSLWVAETAEPKKVRSIALPGDASASPVNQPLAAGRSTTDLYVHYGETLLRIPGGGEDATVATVQGANSARFPLRQVDVRDDVVWTYHDAAARPLDPKNLRPVRALLELPRVDGFASVKVSTVH